MRAFNLVVLTLTLAGSGFAQQFDAVSIKPNKSGANGSHSRTDRGLYTGTNINLLNFITDAYRMKPYQIEGPEWLTTERYDISARLPSDLPTGNDAMLAAFAKMNLQMLKDRFKLEAHQSSKVFSVYGLVVAKPGIKFKEGAGGGSHSSSKGTHYQGENVTMDRFAEFLSHSMDLPVIDMTGLKGSYNLMLDWTEEAGKAANDPGAAAPLLGLALPEALQDELGLRLENRKASIDVVVVDHIERVPTDN